MKKNMFEILRETLQDGMEIVNDRELSNKFKFCITYKGMQAPTELPKATAPGCEVEVCRKAIDNAISTMYINAGNLEEAKKWLDGDMWILEDDIEYHRVNNDTWICNQLEELVIEYEKGIEEMEQESMNVSGDEFIDGHVEGLRNVVNDLKQLLYEK